jgi:hypothetical protein
VCKAKGGKKCVKRKEKEKEKSMRREMRRRRKEGYEQKGEGGKLRKLEGEEECRKDNGKLS